MYKLCVKMLMNYGIYSPRAVSHPRTQPKVQYTTFLPHCCTIYNILSTFDGILVIVHHFVFYARSKAHA